MKTFITSRPETEPARSGPLDPVLTGVAQGLARLFPPVQSARQRREGEASRHGAARRGDGTGGEGSRG
ncbi:MAG: hypothetical protein PGN25_00810 [Methylorubrum populi]